MFIWIFLFLIISKKYLVETLKLYESFCTEKIQKESRKRAYRSNIRNLKIEIYIQNEYINVGKYIKSEKI